MSRNTPTSIVEALDRLRERGDEFNSNRHALELTLAELAAQDRFRPVDAASIQACRLLAAAVDLDCTNAALWAQYRSALEELLTDGDSGDALADLLAGLSAEVRHPSAP